ncbi:MAG: CHAD domain-containing protein [Chloroflexi bacterium]|nr:CHAD domain-containing protein [Chloroflexota bacterium]
MKKALPLEPTMRADTAVKAILKTQLDIIQINEPAIVQDIDPEHLHNYRVALRRTRVALAQAKGVFDTAITHRFKTDLKQITQMSNELRDLDVYLLAEDDYQKLLPDTFRPDIVPLFDYLREKRMVVLEKTIKELTSKKFQHIMADWEAFVTEAQSETADAPYADRSIILLAQKRIYKRYQRVVKDGQKILSAAGDEEMHALRIECKKLRYLLEFFASLFPEEDINLLVKQLKNLQDNLGDFNDLCVQEDYLLAIAAELPTHKNQSRQTLLAIGALVAILHEQRLALKDAFVEPFDTFTAEQNHKRIKQLFQN